MNERPKVVVIAGPNGAGKSTTAPAIVRQAFGIHEFVNADVIARGLSEFAPETVALTAGRVMLRRIKSLGRTLPSRPPLRAAHSSRCYAQCNSVVMSSTWSIFGCKHQSSRSSAFEND